MVNSDPILPVAPITSMQPPPKPEAPESASVRTEPHIAASIITIEIRSNIDLQQRLLCAIFQTRIALDNKGGEQDQKFMLTACQSGLILVSRSEGGGEVKC